MTLAPAAAPARGAGAFDPFGATDLSPCDPDVAGTDAGQRLSGGTKTDPAFGTVGLGVLGLGGNDTLVGKADGRYGDCLRGGAADDRLLGGPGNDTLKGDLGADHLDGGPGADGLEGGDGADALTGGDGADRIDGEAGPDDITGGPGNDWITGGAERNRIDAGPGDDRVSSANGIAETVRCGAGIDTAYADRGDRLIGCEHVHRIASLYPVASPSVGSPRSVFRASIRAPFSTETGAGSAGYMFDVPVHPQGTGCSKMTLPPGLAGEPGRTVALRIRSTRKGGFCRGRYRGTITFASSDTFDNCETMRESRAGRRRLDECDVRVVLGRFSFRVG